MRAMNLYILSRAVETDGFSGLVQEMNAAAHYKQYSVHEARSLRRLVDALVPCLKGGIKEESKEKNRHWIRALDGFYFSYTIAHISKEFDLLKLSEDGSCILNIELKSEAIEEERIRKQLSQNRYYLSHISNTIYSFTYVMETDTVYYLNAKGYMKACPVKELADVLRRPAFETYVAKDLDKHFRASDYLISPAASPEKFLQGNYFLTNQQTEFKRTILEMIESRQESGYSPVITVGGAAGTGKTLLLLDLAMALSKKKMVLFITGGRLSEGYHTINDRLRKVSICEAEQASVSDEYAYVLIDEAGRVDPDTLERLLGQVKKERVPCVVAYDSYRLLSKDADLQRTQSIIIRHSTLNLAFSGNIRINRHVFAFLCTMFHLKEMPPHHDYSSIDILYASDAKEAEVIVRYYEEKGYVKIPLPEGRGMDHTDEVPGLMAGIEYDSVVITLDSRFYYNEETYLCASGDNADALLTLLYEGISRAREKLCLVVIGHEELFGRILQIRQN